MESNQSEQLRSGQDGGPLYRRVADQISQRVALGELVPGQRLPSERQMCATYSVSRVTLRQSLSLLSREGLVSAHPGLGWFVSDTLSEPPGALLSFTEMATSRGLRVGSVILLHEVRSATLDEAEALGVTPGSALLDLARLRSVEGIATAIDRSRLPLALMEGIDAIDFTRSSLHHTLSEKYYLVPSRADYCVEAAAATEVEAAHLGVAAGAPVLSTSQTTFDQHERRIELNQMTYRGDRYRMRATLAAPSRDGMRTVHALTAHTSLSGDGSGHGFRVPDAPPLPRTT